MPTPNTKHLRKYFKPDILKIYNRELDLRVASALARTNARSDRVVLDFFVSFMIKQKRKGKRESCISEEEYGQKDI